MLLPKPQPDDTPGVSAPAAGPLEPQLAAADMPPSGLKGTGDTAAAAAAVPAGCCCTVSGLAIEKPLVCSGVKGGGEGRFEIDCCTAAPADVRASGRSP